MASFVYNVALKEICNGTIDLDTDALKIMLVDDNYVADPDHDTVDQASGNEITATNYTAGFGGAGRKAATLAVAEDDANNRATVTITDLTWASLGGAVNDTVAGAVLIKEAGGNDAGSRLVAFFDVADTNTNGGDMTLDFAAAGAGGNIQFTNA